MKKSPMKRLFRMAAVALLVIAASCSTDNELKLKTEPDQLQQQIGSDAVARVACSAPRTWTLGTQASTSPWHWVGSTFTVIKFTPNISAQPTETGYPSTTLKIRFTNTGLMPMRICIDQNCVSGSPVVVQPGAIKEYNVGILAKGCDSHQVAAILRDYVFYPTACGTLTIEGGVPGYKGQIRAQLISATNGHTANMGQDLYPYNWFFTQNSCPYGG